jgi:hypothetical protein
MFTPNHSNEKCFFKRLPFLFNKKFLNNFENINKLTPCTCFQYAFVYTNPVYSNLEITSDEFTQLALDSGEFEYDHKTDYTYKLHEPGEKVFRDPYIKDALKEYDPILYYSLLDRNKTPRPGRVFNSLLQYCFPMAKPIPKKEHYFHKCQQEAINYVFKNFDTIKPLPASVIFETMPKNTATGWLALKYHGKSQKKEEMMDIIKDEYYAMFNRIKRRQKVNDYVMFAMRGHLSEREKIKTRPVWLVSATTIVSELKYYQPFYDQLANKEFFNKRIITGKKSMSRLRKFLTKSDDYTLYNTDISGWDSFRAAWFHELIMKEFEKKINFSNFAQKLEYRFNIDQAIRSKILMPDGTVLRKRSGIISGTAGTLLINTIINMVLSYTILRMMQYIDFEFEIKKIEDENWLGDDFAFYIDNGLTFDLDKFINMVEKYYTLTVKPEKTVIAKTMDERKYLGYQLKGGMLFRPEKDLFSAVLYSERFFKLGIDFLAISFSRFFSYLLIGGINNFNFLNFFYYYMGKYKRKLLQLDYIFQSSYDNIFKLIKNVWNVNIQTFSIHTFRRMNLELLKYVLLYDEDLVIPNLI